MRRVTTIPQDAFKSTTFSVQVDVDYGFDDTSESYDRDFDCYAVETSASLETMNTLYDDQLETIPPTYSAPDEPEDLVILDHVTFRAERTPNARPNIPNSTWDYGGSVNFNSGGFKADKNRFMIYSFIHLFFGVPFHSATIHTSFGHFTPPVVRPKMLTVSTKTQRGRFV